MIELRNIHKVYPNGIHALNGVSITVQPGEFLVVIGLSGSGKSTLLRCINRIHQPTSGEILFGGQNVSAIEGDSLRAYRKKFGFVFQQFNLVKRKSVLENVLAGQLSEMTTLQTMLGRYSPDAIAKAHQKLEIVGISDKAEFRADSLSGGQQQRVAIARTLMQDPAVILADEPVASLDPATSHSVMKYLEYVNKELGTTVVCNLHFLSLVRQYASRVVALKSGEIVFEGQPNDITEEWFQTIYGENAKEVEIR